MQLTWLVKYRRILEVIFILFILVYLGLVAAELWQPTYSFLPPKIDFEVYWSGGKSVLQHTPLYTDTSSTPVTGENLGFTYPPIAALFFTIFAWLPVKVSIFIWVVLTMLTLWGTIYWLLKNMFQVTTSLMPLTQLFFLLSMGIGPVRETFNFGQINILLMLLICLDYLVVPPQYKGILLGLTIALKLTPAALLLFIILAKKYRILVNTLATVMGVSLLSFLFLWEDSKKFWSQVFSTTRIGKLDNPSNQSINGFLARISSGEPDKKIWLLLCLVVIILAALIMKSLIRRGQPQAAFIVNTLLMLLISPISWTHHWVWCVPALLYLFFQWGKAGVVSWLSNLWLVLGLLTFYLTPQFLLPADSAYAHTWLWYYHLAGNSFSLWAIGFMLLAVIRAVVENEN